MTWRSLQNLRPLPVHQAWLRPFSADSWGKTHLILMEQQALRDPLTPRKRGGSQVSLGSERCAEKVGARQSPASFPWPRTGRLLAGSCPRCTDLEQPRWERVRRGAGVPLSRERMKESSASSHEWSLCLFSRAGTESQKFFYDPFSGLSPCFFWNSEATS